MIIGASICYLNYISEFSLLIVNCVRQTISPAVNRDFSILSVVSDVFDHFELNSLSTPSQVVKSLKPTICFLDVIPAKILKAAFDIVGLELLNFINTSSNSGVVPSAFKHAVVSLFIVMLIICRYIFPSVCEKELTQQSSG